MAPRRASPLCCQSLFPALNPGLRQGPPGLFGARSWTVHLRAVASRVCPCVCVSAHMCVCPCVCTRVCACVLYTYVCALYKHVCICVVSIHAHVCARVRVCTPHGAWPRDGMGAGRRRWLVCWSRSMWPRVGGWRLSLLELVLCTATWRPRAHLVFAQKSNRKLCSCSSALQLTSSIWSIPDHKRETHTRSCFSATTFWAASPAERGNFLS